MIVVVFVHENVNDDEPLEYANDKLNDKLPEFVKFIKVETLITVSYPLYAKPKEHEFTVGVVDDVPVKVPVGPITPLKPKPF